MKLNRTNKKITSLLFSILMITSVFAGFVTPVMASIPLNTPSGRGIISGRVICCAGNPVAGASIRVGKQMYIGSEGWATTDADGNYTITGLATGNYDMRVHPPYGVNLIQAFTGFLITDIVVTVGETTIVNVTMKEGGIISGRVTCYAGNPVAGALINVEDMVTRNRKGAAFTDADGNYTITGLATGTYEMRICPSHVNLTPAFITNIVVIAGETTVVNVTLEKGGIISGRVTCYAGNPVADAGVDAVISVRGWGAQTDTDGNYTITGLAAGTYEMSVHPPLGSDLVPAFITDIVVIAGETTIVNVTLEKGGIISGRVTCYAGNPVADASISVWVPATITWSETRTDADGNYTITGLVTGIYKMTVNPPEGIYLAPARTTDILVTVSETTIINVTLEKGGIISGRIICYEGNPVVNARIFVQDPVTEFYDWAQTDADGNYIIIGLAIGTYEMNVYPPYGIYLLPAFITDILVTDGETTIVNVTLEKGGIISGRIICHVGNPVVNILISVRDLETRAVGHAWTDADGSYTITGLATGIYNMTVQPWRINLAPAFITDIVVTVGETTIVDVTLEKGGIISGRVTCYAGNPVVNAEINVRSPVAGFGTQTVADGSYTIIDLAAGTYEMDVYPPYGVYLASVFITDIVITAGETTIVNVTIEEGGLISGRVICHAGNPVVDALISVWDPETGAGGRAQTDADGNYTTTGLATGTYKMRVHPPYGINLALAFITDIVVTAGETTIVNVTMEEEGLISGRIICHAGNPVVNARINVSDPVIGDWGWVWTDADGNYTITGLATGTYEMRVHPPRGVNLLPAFITNIVVTAGETTIVNVTMEVLPVKPKPAPRIPGFGIIAAILGILGAVLILLKKKN